MKTPIAKPIHPWPPHPGDYEEKIERKYIYKFEEKFDEDEHWDEDEDEEDKEPEEQILVSDINLQWLLDRIPDGIKPEQIKVEFDYEASSMSYESHHVAFYYEEKIPARTEEYKAAIAQYEKDQIQYQIDVAEYEKAYLQKEIKETEEKLAKLTGYQIHTIPKK